MKEYLISGDFGKDTSKMLGKEKNESSDKIKRVYFKTKIYDLGKGDIDVEGNSHKIELDGQKYIVGEQGTKKSYDTSKTQLIHKLCCYAGICQYLEPKTKDNKIYMVLACPLSVLRSPEAKEEFKNFIKGEGVISLTVDEEEYEFEIVDILIKAEGSGILYTDTKLFMDKDVVLIDIGGLNLGINVYRNCVCTKDDRYPEEYGNEMLIKSIQERMSHYFKGNIISESEAEKILNDGYASKFGKCDRDSIPYLEEAKKNYFDGLMDIIRKNKISLQLYDNIVFVGGTVKRIEDIIREAIPSVIIPQDPQWSTAEGLYSLIFAKYGQLDNKKVSK